MASKYLSLIGNTEELKYILRLCARVMLQNFSAFKIIKKNKRRHFAEKFANELHFVLCGICFIIEGLEHPDRRRHFLHHRGVL